MKMTIDEFRARLAELARGKEVVDVTDGSETIGRFVPWSAAKDGDTQLAAELAELQAMKDAWIAGTPDWKERLAAIGIDYRDLE